VLDMPATIGQWVSGQARSPWPDYEYVKGWGVFGLPFSSGHVLALRVFPHSTFGPYRTVWHCEPDGRWSIHVDGPRLETACPRYYGPACDYTGFARIDLTWTGPTDLRVSMDDPALEWTLTATSTPVLTAANALGAALPAASWRPRSLVRARELMARALGVGRLEMTGVMPSGHTGTLMPQRMYFVEESHATLGGVDLGRPVHLRRNPTIGDVPLPARGILAIGQAIWGPLAHP
jgi:hypothetical protein